MVKHYEVIIIGGGPIGIACALGCKEKNINYLILEKGTLVNSLYHYPLNMSFFSTAEKLELNHIPFISNNPKPTRSEALEYYRRVVTSNKLNINLYEEVIEVLKTDTHFSVNTNKQSYTSQKIIIATGFYDLPNTLNIDGAQLPKVSYYFKEAHPYALQKVAIVGASNSAVDAALEIWQKGGEITMIVRGAAIGERVKYWVKPNIENRINEGSIKAFFNSEIKEIKEKEVIVSTPQGSITLKNDFVLALTGYQPNLPFLQKIGIQLSSEGLYKPYYNPETMESNVEGVYLAGVICGGMETHKWFIENSRIHADLITQHICNTA